MIIEGIIWISKSFPLSFAKTKWHLFSPGKGCQRLKETVYWQTPSETEQRNFPLIWVQNWQAALVWALHKYSVMINMWIVQRNHFVISRTLPKCQWLKQDVDSPLQSLNTNSPVQLVTWNETEQGQWTNLSWSLGWWLYWYIAEQTEAVGGIFKPPLPKLPSNRDSATPFYGKKQPCFMLHGICRLCL